MKEAYNKVYGEYKKEFSSFGQRTTSEHLRCFAAYLWTKKEHEILKKYVLAEAYLEVLKDSLESLAAESSLMKAMQGSFRGNDDYPQSIDLKMNGNESARLNKLKEVYKTMYLDAYIAAEQCEALQFVNEPITKKPEAGVTADMQPSEDEAKADQAIFFCFDNWLRMEKQFKPKFPEEEFKYNFRNISKDAMRCQLLYIPIQIIRQLL